MTMMRDCPDGALRDLLPDFVHETLAPGDRATVAAHVATCTDCAAEVALIRAARRAFPAPTVDTARIVNALPGAKRAAVAGGLRGRQWLLAAGVSFVLLGGISIAVVQGAFNRRTGGAVDAAIVTAQGGGADRATPVGVRLAEGESAAKAAPRTVGLSFGGGLSDLSDEQLKALLREIEVLDASLGAEPESHPIPVVPLRGGGDNAW
jgi:anti-sigma factor RsiW